MILVDRVTRRLRAAGRVCRTVVLRLRFSDYSRATRSYTMLEPTADTQTILAAATGLLTIAMPVISRRGLTLIGIALTDFEDQSGVQLRLPFERVRELDETLHRIRDRFGSQAVTRGHSSAATRVPGSRCCRLASRVGPGVELALGAGKRIVSTPGHTLCLVSNLPTACVIGAGVSGLTAVKALGDWTFLTPASRPPTTSGATRASEPHGRSSAYRSLHIDTSKNAISFADFPMDGRYPDFPHHTEIKQFLHDYAGAVRAARADPLQHGRRAGRAPSENGGWRITSADGEERSFDALLVCNGHHWDPSYPELPGDFVGVTLHSHHYIDPTDPLDLTGKRVLVVGIGNSAVDITSELARKGVAERVFISTRSGAWVVPKYVFGRPADQVFKTNPRLPLRPPTAYGPLPAARLVSGKMEDFGLPTPNHNFLEAHPTVSSELLLRLGSGDAVAKPECRGAAW